MEESKIEKIPQDNAEKKLTSKVEVLKAEVLELEKKKASLHSDIIVQFKDAIAKIDDRERDTRELLNKATVLFTDAERQSSVLKEQKESFDAEKAEFEKERLSYQKSHEETARNITSEKNALRVLNDALDKEREQFSTLKNEHEKVYLTQNAELDKLIAEREFIVIENQRLSDTLELIKKERGTLEAVRRDVLLSEAESARKLQSIQDERNALLGLRGLFDTERDEIMKANDSIAEEKKRIKEIHLAQKEKETELNKMENDLVEFKKKLLQQKQRQDNAK